MSSKPSPISNCSRRAHQVLRTLSSCALLVMVAAPLQVESTLAALAHAGCCSRRRCRGSCSPSSFQQHRHFHHCMWCCLSRLCRLHICERDCAHSFYPPECHRLRPFACCIIWYAFTFALGKPRDCYTNASPNRHSISDCIRFALYRPCGGILGHRPAFGGNCCFGACCR
jgi:hypothetical protein